MKIRNIVLTLLLLSGISAIAQQKLVPIEAKLKGEWQIKSVSLERYHMQQGNLLGREEVSKYDSILRVGGVLLNIVFEDSHCTVKQPGGRYTWDYVRGDSARLELKATQIAAVPTGTPQQQLMIQYTFGSNGDLYIGPITSGYMDRSTGVPVKMKYTSHYTRVQ